MKVFLDTEFTDSMNPRLISAGLVSADGREFYCELADGWATEHCTEFVIETVLPLIDGRAMTRDVAGAALFAWLRSFNEAVTIIYDIETDWRLLTGLVSGPTRQKTSLLLKKCSRGLGLK